MRAIEERADQLQANLDAMRPVGEEVTFWPQVRPILEPRIDGLHEAARIVRALPDAERGWIPADERVPEDDDNVLIFLRESEDIVIGYWDGSLWYFRGDVVLVTHWMPLPDPPELPAAPEPADLPPPWPGYPGPRRPFWTPAEPTGD
jgi:hypothetical protein